MNKLLITTLILSLSSSFTIAQDKPDAIDKTLVIHSVEPMIDPSLCDSAFCAGTLTIQGTGFSKELDFEGIVSIYDPVSETETELPVVGFEPSVQELIVELPVNFASLAGTYSISVSSDDKNSNQVTYPITIGTIGLTGADGADGTNGIDGNDGQDSTVQGPQGEQGPIGPQGALGSDGVDGVDGVDGAPGLQGIPGANGTTPIKGVDYFDGDTGADGSQGEQGEPGLTGQQGPQGPIESKTLARNWQFGNAQGGGGGNVGLEISLPKTNDNGLSSYTLLTRFGITEGESISSIKILLYSNVSFELGARLHQHSFDPLNIDAPPTLFEETGTLIVYGMGGSAYARTPQWVTLNFAPSIVLSEESASLHLVNRSILGSTAGIGIYQVVVE